MPRLTTGLSSSPDHFRCRPSMPIEIPKRRKSPVSPLISPIDQPKSPDLIFDMSPISPSPLNHTIPLSTPNRTNNHGPFTYTVPVYIPSRHTNTGTRFSTPSQQQIMPSSTAAPISAVHGNVWRIQTTPTQNVNNNHDSNPQSAKNGLTQTQSTTKITGFIPTIEHQSPMADHPSKPVGRLSPPRRRRASYSSSPSILPGNGSVEDDYSQVDPSVFEFKRHLLRRIENRDASRFMSFHSCL